MSLSNALETLHRQLSLRWSEIPETAGGLSWSEYKYLRAVETISGHCRKGPKGARPGSPHLTELTGALGIKRPSASVMLRKLERQGLLQRAACRADARAQHVLMTKKGASAVKQCAALYERSARTISARLNARDTKTLQKILGHVCDDA